MCMSGTRTGEWGKITKLLAEERRGRLFFCWGLEGTSLWPRLRVMGLLPRPSGLGSSSLGLGESLLRVRTARGDALPSTCREILKAEHLITYLSVFIFFESSYLCLVQRVRPLYRWKNFNSPNSAQHQALIPFPQNQPLNKFQRGNNYALTAY